MKRKSNGLSGAFALALWTAGCSGPTVRTQYDHSVHFDGLHTYSWQTESGPIGQSVSQPTLDRRIRSTIDDALQAKGFHTASVKDADVSLRYSTVEEKKVDAHLKNYEVAEFMDLTYILGTLQLQMMRGVPPVVIWNGTVQANIDTSRPLEERDQKLREAVQKLLATFPPPKS